MTYPAGMLHNTSTGRFHPILFRPAPMPGGADRDGGVMRYRSLGHHTEGFDTKEQAMAWLDSRGDTKNYGEQWEWDGREIPALTSWYPAP